jgi:fluoride exporter
LNHFLLITLGAIIGANARYLLVVWAANRLGVTFPCGTLLVKVSGSLILGFVLFLTTERLSISPEIRLFLTVGVLGSYTTFSTFSVETINLLHGGSMWHGLLNIAGNNILGIVAALIGAQLARFIQ